MVFSSLLFLFRFLPLVLLLYYVAPVRLRNLVLFVASLIFYAWGEPVYVILIICSTLVDYCAGRAVAHYKEKQQKKKAASFVVLSAVINLSLLGFFKYGDFLLRIFGSVTGLSVPTLDLPLPIGISFYTFQTMSYTIDVYRGDAPVQKNFIAFGAYVALFPQLIAGPIIRYKTVADQLQNRKETLDLFAKGILRFSIGLGKKVLLANQLGALFQQTAALTGQNVTTASAWLGILAFTLQIYFDFSGYSDMAIGLGYMFGFTFPENFRYPYESKSITEFWRRWHISLGTWFLEYVYIPLGGNRKGRVKQIRNIAIVWLLTGLWHGAYLNFVLWGVYYGMLLLLEKFVFASLLERIPAWCRHLLTMVLVMVGWAIFSWQDLADPKGYLEAMFFLGGSSVYDQSCLSLFTSNVLLLVLALIGATSLVKKVAATKLFSKENTVRAVMTMAFVLVTMVLCVAFLVNDSYNPFLYFRF